MRQLSNQGAYILAMFAGLILGGLAADFELTAASTSLYVVSVVSFVALFAVDKD